MIYSSDVHASRVSGQQGRTAFEGDIDPLDR